MISYGWIYSLDAQRNLFLRPSLNFRIRRIKRRKFKFGCPLGKCNMPRPDISSSERLSQMECQRAAVQNPVVTRPGAIHTINEVVANISKQWHSMRLLPKGPQFIEDVYIAQGLSAVVLKKAQDQMESILQSRPTVKPLMKRRRLPSRAGEPPVEPKQAPKKQVTPRSSLAEVEPSMPVLEPSIPVLQPSLPVLEHSLPVLEHSLPASASSAPISLETVTVYAGITDTQPVSRLSESAQLHKSRFKENTPLLAKTKLLPPPSASETPVISQISKPEGVLKLTAPPSMNATVLPTTTVIQTPSPSNDVRIPLSLPGISQGFAGPPLTVTNVSSAFKSIFDPIATDKTYPLQKSPIKSSMAKKSTTPRARNNVPLNKIEVLKCMYGIRECQVILYNYSKDYGTTMRFGEWDFTKPSKMTDVGKMEKKKDKKKKKLKEPKPKLFLPGQNQKKKRGATKDCDQPIAKKIKSDILEMPVQTNIVPKVRILTRIDLDDPVGMAMLGDSPKGDKPREIKPGASSNKENFISADHGSCDGSEVKLKQTALKLSVPTSHPATPGKKGIDIKSVSWSTESIQEDELYNSDKALVIQMPQAGAPTDRCMDKEKSGGNKTELAANSPPKLSLLAGTVPAHVVSTDSSTQPIQMSSNRSPSQIQVLSQARDKPVISLEAYHARKSSLKRGQDSSSGSSPTHQGTDSACDPTVPTPKHNGHTSPDPASGGKKKSTDPKLKLPSTSDSTTSSSSKSNGYASPSHTPENKQSTTTEQLNHILHHPVTPQDSPKKTKPATLNGASTPIAAQFEQKSVLNEDITSVSPKRIKVDGDELRSPSPLPASISALKFMSLSKETHNNYGADLKRKLLLSAVAENNNNTMCVGFERMTSLPVDNTATAELDLTSVALQPLLDMHRRTHYSQLKMVQWENCICYRCDKVFPLYDAWSSHGRTCI